MATFALIKGAVDIAINTKKAVEFFKTLGQSEEEGFYLWRMLDSLTPSLRIVFALRRRHATLPLVDSAAELCKYTIARCEGILQRDASEDDSRPEDAQSWGKWFEHKKNGVSRRQAVKDMLDRMTLCQNTLQLALTSLIITCPAHQLKPRAPFTWCPGAQDHAYSIIQEFEFGRMDTEGMLFCTGVVQKHELASGARKGDGLHTVWKPRGDMKVFLVMENNGTSTGQFSLRFRKMKASPLQDDNDSEEEGEDVEESVSITSNLPFKRMWLDEVANLEVDAEDADSVTYAIGDYILLFDSVGKVSAEVFESVVCMLKRMAPQDGKEAMCLGESVSDVRASAWKDYVEKQLGQFASEPHRGPGADDILSPMKNLRLA